MASVVALIWVYWAIVLEDCVVAVVVLKDCAAAVVWVYWPT
jgi:predicted transcriptional regulator